MAAMCSSTNASATSALPSARIPTRGAQLGLWERPLGSVTTERSVRRSRAPWRFVGTHCGGRSSLGKLPVSVVPHRPDTKSHLESSHSLRQTNNPTSTKNRARHVQLMPKCVARILHGDLYQPWEAYRVVRSAGHPGLRRWIVLKSLHVIT